MSYRTQERISVHPFVRENRTLCLGGRGEGAQGPGGEGSRSWEGSGPGRTFACSGGRKFSPLFYRTSSFSSPLPKKEKEDFPICGGMIGLNDGVAE